MASVLLPPEIFPMKLRPILCILFAFFVLDPGLRAQDEPADLGWPRTYHIAAGEVTLYQPQVDAWEDYSQLQTRLAVAVQLTGASQPVFGVVDLTARTATDLESRLVTLYRPVITDIRFPGVSADDEAKFAAAVRALPATSESVTISLDRVLAYVQLNETQQKGVEVNLAPPPIFYSDRAALLVSFLGEPRFQPIEGTKLEFALNTNWDVLRDPATGVYYLLSNASWFATGNLTKGTWASVATLPAAFSNLPKQEAWDRVRAALPGKPAAVVPQIFVSLTPAEIILTDGKPKFDPIPGTQLAAVSNSENTLFYHSGEGQFYFMAAGRWFRAKALAGPWLPATKDLPADFAAIPDDGPWSDIREAVPGTPEAKDAVLLASIPRKAVVNRNEAKVDVTYDGSPVFRAIEKTQVEYAANTSYDVLRSGGSYYCCYQAVWFVAPSANGPWVVASSIPAEIYSIPPSSPKYNVTYVHIYESTPTTVTCGHTSGYEGEVVSDGVVMFGVAVGVGLIIANNSDNFYYHPWYWGYGPRPMPYYGHIHYASGPNGHAWSAHGPYGGYGYGAGYNPATGTYHRGAAAYGPYGGAGYRTAYNPTTGTGATQRGGYNAYGSWKQTAVRNGDDWARGARVSDERGTAGGFRTSSGAAGIGAKTDNGQGYVVRDKEGNVYAGKDGNIYKKDENGGWQTRENGGWSSASTQPAASTNQARTADTRPSATAGTGPSPTPSPRPAPATTRASPTASNGYGGGNTGARLNYDAQARQTGNNRAMRSSSMRGGGRRGR